MLAYPCTTEAVRPRAQSTKSDKLRNFCPPVDLLYMGFKDWLLNGLFLVLEMCPSLTCVNGGGYTLKTHIIYVVEKCTTLYDVVVGRKTWACSR